MRERTLLMAEVIGRQNIASWIAKQREQYKATPVVWEITR
jgi:hypothetical protein